MAKDSSDGRAEQQHTATDLGLSPKTEIPSPAVPAMFETDAFIERVESRMRSATKRGTLAYIEIQDLRIDTSADRDGLANPIVGYAEIFHQISEGTGQDDIFCWHEGRFILLFSHATTTHQTLRRIGRGIAKSPCSINGAPVHLTPAIGYADLRMAKTAPSLWQMAETALDCAKSSLEIEPFRYVRKLNAGGRREWLANLLGIWSKVPAGVGLVVQFLLSLVLGLGAPFIVYAIFDALGADISGPVYVGVVVVLVITATTIWIENILALKPTAPPQEPGSAFPPASMIIPAYLPNEADTIVDTVKAFLRLDYPNTVQIIVAYNTPRDLPVEGELEAIAASLPSDGRFIIEPVRVAGSTSKAQNVNAVIGRVRGHFVGIFDADHHPRPDSLQRAWRWLSNGWDVVQGRCQIRNGADSWVARMVAVEFEQIYAVSHPGRARFHGFGIFGGSNGFWRTTVLHETRMRHSMLTEDIDSSIRAVKAGYRIAGDRDLVSEELAPTSLHQLLNQRLRWAQGWFQVSFRRVIPTIFSPHVTMRQKFGLIHLLIWRELFPWYSIQVVPIMTYWVWAYGWHYIHWAVPIFLATTIYTFSTGPAQILFAYWLAEKSMRRRPGWFVEYLIVSTFFYSPFKDSLSRIAHLKEAMRERAWRVTPRAPSPRIPAPQGATASAAVVALLALFLFTGRSEAQTTASPPATGFSRQYLETLLGGEVATINAARRAAREGRQAEAAKLFGQAISAVPGRRAELLHEYADALTGAGRGKEAVPLYQELLASPALRADEKPAIGYRLALALSAAGQYRVALGLYDDMLAHAPGDADLAVRRARILSLLGRQDDALAAIDRVAPEKWAAGPLGSLGDAIFIDAARKSAKAGQSVEAVDLFERAIRHNAGLRASLLPEYADQILMAGRAADAVPLYREIISGHLAPLAKQTEATLGLAQALLQSGQHKDAYKTYTAALTQSSPGTANYKKAQRGQSLALTLSDAPTKALGAWTEYLKTTPGDADAILHQAQMFSALHQDERALQAYRAVYAIDPQNGTAKRGMVEQTINLARIAARDDRNDDSAALFASAIALDAKKRKELLREYADQLSFADRSADAIPLYREVLDGGALSDLDRKRAMTGLADAYAWTGRADDALATYAELVAANPDDVGLQWNRLVFAARQAARMDKNSEAADLFAQATRLRPDGSAGIQQEYADQLSFDGRAGEAVPLYQQVLAADVLSSSDKRRAMTGLADAYAWSNQPEKALVAYTKLAAAYPDDVGLQWNRLVFAAREAAQTDKNKDAAELFAQAIKLSPDRGARILREYADQLSFTGQAQEAVALYHQVLDQPSLTQTERWAAKRGLAQAYDWSGRLDAAKSAYGELAGAFPDDVSLQWNLLVASARQAADTDRNKDAANLFAEAIQLLPERRSLILREYADKLTFSGNAKDAVPLYRELLAKDSVAPDSRTDELGLARALAWANRPIEAVAEYQRLIAADPDDVAVRKGLAQALSWAGRQTEAEAAYRQILARMPNDAEAQRGLAQVEDWQGHHQLAQALLTQRLADDPGDIEARRLLAQSQIWMGRPDKAMNELDFALAQLQTPNGFASLQNRTNTQRPVTIVEPSNIENIDSVRVGFHSDNRQ